MSVIAVVPAYRETERIAAVVRGVIKHLPCIVVDDGSGDATGDVARDAGATVLVHPRNAGKGAALATGFACARDHGHEGVVTLDADGQHDPAVIPDFLEVARGGADIVVGRRQEWASNGMPLIRRMTNSLTSAIISRMARCQIGDSQCGYRYVRVETWFAARPQTTSFDAESELLIRAGRMGYRIAETPIPTIYAGEQSKIRPVADTLRFIRLFARYAGRRL